MLCRAIATAGWQISTVGMELRVRVGGILEAEADWAMAAITASEAEVALKADDQGGRWHRCRNF